jgi:hypothetical protein
MPWTTRLDRLDPQGAITAAAQEPLTGCGKSRFASKSQPSAAKAALIQQLLRTG